MVWFDCECGESLKKPAVAKHLYARNCSYVTCVDCHKSFDREEYESHIKCISEAQKYMGKLYQVDSQKKEGAKQDNWIASVSAALEGYNGPLKELVNRLSLYDNIPRKQKAFENFVANSLNLKRDLNTVRKLWEIVEPCSRVKPTERVSDNKTTERTWSGFEEEIAEVLRSNGGSMPWKLLQAHVAKRRKIVFPDEDYESIKVEALASIPRKYLSDTCNMVSI
jgi:hypothetical protein